MRTVSTYSFICAYMLILYSSHVRSDMDVTSSTHDHDRRHGRHRDSYFGYSADNDLTVAAVAAPPPSRTGTTPQVSYNENIVFLLTLS